MYERFRARGGLWVAAQMILILSMLGVLLLLRGSGIEAEWPGQMRRPSIVFGSVTLICTAMLLAVAILNLGRSLTAFPRPLHNGRLVVHGAYAIVRHPIYTSIFLAMLGIAFILQSTVGLLCAAITLIFFDRKASHEEKMLIAAYPDYAEYRRRVRKLIPLLY